MRLQRGERRVGTRTDRRLRSGVSGTNRQGALGVKRETRPITELRGIANESIAQHDARFCWLCRAAWRPVQKDCLGSDAQTLLAGEPPPRCCSLSARRVRRRIPSAPPALLAAQGDSARTCSSGWPQPAGVLVLGRLGTWELGLGGERQRDSLHCTLRRPPVGQRSALPASHCSFSMP